MKTRDRILHKSLELFNELGEPNVTTLLISDELDISPGNLYYHFKSKTDILTNLFEWFENEMGALLEAPNTTPDIEDQWFFLHLIFEHIEKYQFLYKDIVHVLGRHDNIKLRFNKIIQKKRKATLNILKGLEEQGSIEANNDELEALCENIVLTATFWINYCIVSSNKSLSEDMLARGVYQVISLVAPFLDKEQRQLLNELKKAYL
ncbi:MULTISPECIES: TetR/AcrR family transcriptional regulator [unclassified Oleiphilus]|jgi:AcrR family transcriptional regulator|uniref:TetR/AcrR family transcriptional regulator n=1 Tax=unclassified Oleiphilus TaxID=2631174 RepID=UPI0007C2DB37|nr:MULTISPECIES: TetR/AcrR family transcriptional regulator [unclassified Oleiphilus]KZY43227.1 TetR family transcriptional regulator [Oleiphilus sp. HI0050]KZY77020.1 TetR family transcriptional regulator [Oleiphilus sp. HI0069]KZY83991.1 TetR family transcriptional regulator [Oleiphilus sp. HI0068]KZY88307.1 TetR family transcriptional regulator [Oleiphilus sp. HI0072]KZZ12304.1 TetR family transcriptional regulator [Oleiphilus sp. HI0078]KZZ24731.1 TetR family transcriptional regulator [Ol